MRSAQNVIGGKSQEKKSLGRPIPATVTIPYMYSLFP
jgi:hypothetical protein